MLNNLLREKSKEDLISMIRDMESRTCSECKFYDKQEKTYGWCIDENMVKIRNYSVQPSFFCADFERKLDE